MSLFHTNEWWSHKPDQPSECSPSSLLCCNIDNDPSGSDKLVTASFSGHLRIFTPTQPGRIENLLLEQQMDEPILQIEAGRFIPASSSRLALAVLYPKRLSVYLVNAVRGSGGEGAAYMELQHSYTHRFHHHAYSLAYGPFGGGLQGRDMLAVLTLDGQLLFYQQDTFAFSRYLPGFLLPGAFTYLRSVDAFVLASPRGELECYRYSTLGESTQDGARHKGGGGGQEEEEEEAESKQQMEAEYRAVHNAKRLHTDWTLNLGEPVLDIQVGRVLKGGGDGGGGADVVVLSAHNLWVLRDNGAVRVSKRLHYTPLALHVYPTHAAAQLDHVLVGCEESALYVYADMSLVWAARTPIVPVSLRVASSLSSPPISGLLVGQSDCCALGVWYLGTDPPQGAVATGGGSRELDYDGMDAEHRKLLKVIKQAASDKMQEPKEKLIVRLRTGAERVVDERERGGLDVCMDDGGRPVCCEVSVELSHTALLPMTGVHVTLALPHPFATPRPHQQVELLPPASSSSSSPPTLLTFPVYLLRCAHPIPSIAVDALVTYTTADGLTRSAAQSARLPLYMVGRVKQPTKQTAHFFTLDTNKSPPPLTALFGDLFDGAADGSLAEAGASVLTLYCWGGGADVSILVSKKSGRYRLQSSQYAHFGVLMSELVQRLHAHFAASAGSGDELVVRFEEDLPFGDYFPLLDRYHAQRGAVAALLARLTQLSHQFRAVQKRLLVRYKDKNPTALGGLDVLLAETAECIQAATDELAREREALAALSMELASASAQLVALMGWKYQLDRRNADMLRQLFHTGGGEERVGSGGLELDAASGSGWVERLDASLIYALKHVLTKARAADEAAGGGSAPPPPPTIHTEAMKDISRVKKHLIMLSERMAKGMRMVPAAAKAEGGAAKSSAAPQGPGTPPASASGARRGEERRRQSSVDMREAAQTLVEVEEEDG